MKRENYLSWNAYFMAIAIVSSMRSKDPNTQVGACIVDENKKILGIGYNGFPIGCSDDIFPWERKGGFLDTKYPYVVHAEVNALVNSFDKKGLKNSSLFVTLFPCHECAKIIIQSGIKKIYYLNDCYAGTESHIASEKMLQSAGIECEKFIPEEDFILVNFK